MSSRGSFIVVVLALLAVQACTSDAGGNRGEGRGTGSPTLTQEQRFRSHLPPEEPRPFVKIEDEPGGPAHEAAFPSRPAMDEVEAAATAGAGRAEAEAFAVIVSNAFDDSTESGIGHDQLEAYLAGDIHPEGRQWIDAKQADQGVRVVKGDEDPWIRSQFGTDTEGRPQAMVEFVELIEIPAEETLVVGEIFRFWNMYQMTVRHDGSWVVVDYQPSVASESEVFSEWMWEGVMDSGEGWRRFSLAE